MTYAQAKRNIETLRNPTSRMEAYGSSHWVLFFDNKDRVFRAYDAKDPISCLDSVTRNHPTYEYVVAKGMPTAGSAVEWAKAFRLVADLTPELLTLLETGRAADKQ